MKIFGAHSTIHCRGARTYKLPQKSAKQITETHRVYGTHYMNYQPMFEIAMLSSTHIERPCILSFNSNSAGVIMYSATDDELPNLQSHTI